MNCRCFWHPKMKVKIAITYYYDSLNSLHFTCKEMEDRKTKLHKTLQTTHQHVSSKELVGFGPFSPPLRGQSSHAVQSGNSGIMISW